MPGRRFAVFSFWHAHDVPPGKRIPHKALYCAKLNTSAKYALKGTSLHASFRLHAILRTTSPEPSCFQVVLRDPLTHPLSCGPPMVHDELLVLAPRYCENKQTHIGEKILYQ